METDGLVLEPVHVVEAGKIIDKEIDQGSCGAFGFFNEEHSTAAETLRPISSGILFHN